MRTIILALFCLTVYLTLDAQSSIESANNNFNNQQWSAAIGGYQTYLQKAPADSVAWLKLGIAQMNIGGYEESLHSLDQANKNGFNPMVVNFQIAKVFALQSSANKSLGVLKDMSNRGYAGFNQIKSDEAFKGLKDEPDWLEVLAQIKINATPCVSNINTKKLDFWLGKWDVFVNNQHTATSTISKDEGACTLHENYQTFGGFTGRSINYIDPTDSLYTQIWIDKFNSILKFKEIDSRDGYLQLRTYYPDRNTRMSYELNAEGHVIQILESSSDSGQTWQNTFTGVYKRQENTAVPLSSFESTKDIIEKSIGFHDPNNTWPSWGDTFYVVEPRPQTPTRATHLIFDNTLDEFYFQRNYGLDTVRYHLINDSCSYSVNGKTDLAEVMLEKHRLSCDRGHGYRFFYEQSLGLPMILNNYEWKASSVPEKILLDNAEAIVCYLHIANAIFSEDWILYFDPNTYQVIAYAYIPADDDRNGEIIKVEHWIENNGIKITQKRSWYDRLTGEYLGSDIFLNK